MMKYLKIILTLIPFFAYGLALAATQSANQQTLELSYAIGYEMGKSFKNNDINVNSNYFSKGVREGLYGTQTPYLSEGQITKVLRHFRDASIAQKQKALKTLAKINLKNGKAFLKQNAHKPGVVAFQSGLQYKILQSGSSLQKPTRNDTVVVNYTAKHLNGKVFDNGVHSTFQVSSVIAGWQQILPMMRVGDHWKVYVPSHLAYGPEGAPDIIGPNETIAYEISLISIQHGTKS